MKKTQKIISVLIALCLLMCAFPAMAFAEVTEYPLIVNNVRVTSENCTDVLGDGTVICDPTSGTLTLRSAKLTCSEPLSLSGGEVVQGDGPTGILCAIYCEDDLTIVLDGSSTIVADGTNGNFVAAIGIGTEGDLTISESANGGSLSVTAKAKDAEEVSGIISYNMTVNGGNINVTADGGAALETAVAPVSNDSAANGEPDKSEDKPVIEGAPEIEMDIFGEDGAVPGYPGEESGTYTMCIALRANGDYTQSKGTVTATATSAYVCGAVYSEETMTVTGGKLTAIAGDAEEGSVGIYADGIAVSGSGTVVSATSGNALSGSYGIDSDEYMTVDGGTVTATAGSASYDSIGINVGGDYTQTAGTVTATAGTATQDYSIGLDAYDVTVSGGALNAYGADDSYDSYGIYADGELTVSGGAVKAVGRDAMDDSYGVEAYSTVTVSGGTLDMRSGSPDDDSFACYCYKMIVSGGTVNAVCEGSDYNSYGVHTEEYNQTGGKVTATAGKGRYGSIGLFVDTYDNTPDTSILGGTLTAISGDANEESAGICQYDSRALIISGADTVVTAKSGNVKSYGSAGLSLNGSLIIDGATVTAEGGTSSKENSNGAEAGNIIINGGVLRGTANEASYSSNGIYTDGLVVNGGEVFGTSNAAKAQYINGIAVDDFCGEFGYYGSGKLELNAGRVTALCNDSVTDRSASAIWTENGITAPEHYTATGAKETYASGINELLQKVSGTPVVLKADTDVVRLSGNSRVLTAIEISKKGWEDGSDTVILASGNNYADVLAVVPYAYKLDAPVLLSVSATLDADILAEIERLGASKAIILGGTAAVPQAVEDSIKAEGLTVERIAGSSRNETAAKIAQKLEPTSGDAFLVSNANFADAISCSSIAALLDAPILYINADGTLPAETKTALEDNNIDSVYIIGGTGAVGAAAETQLDALDIDSRRLFGNNRYATSVAVYNEFADEYATTRHAVATGKAFPDATAGAAFAAKNGMHIFLVDEGMPDSIASTIRGRGALTLYIFGGTSAVTENTVESIL